MRQLIAVFTIVCFLSQGFSWASMPCMMGSGIEQTPSLVNEHSHHSFTGSHSFTDSEPSVDSHSAHTEPLTDESTITKTHSPDASLTHDHHTEMSDNEEHSCDDDSCCESECSCPMNGCSSAFVLASQDTDRVLPIPSAIIELPHQSVPFLLTQSLYRPPITA